MYVTVTLLGSERRPRSEKLVDLPTKVLVPATAAREHARRLGTRIRHRGAPGHLEQTIDVRGRDGCGERRAAVSGASG